MRMLDWSSDVCSSDLLSAPMKTRRSIAWGALALIVLLAGGVALYAHLMTPKLQLGVGYGARVACGCRYIEGRPLKCCYKDFEPGMEVIHQLGRASCRERVCPYV